MHTLSAYMPMDRRQALARGATLPQYTQGCALFADVSGFTPLARSLTAQLGPQRGAEELTFYLNQVYDALIAQVHRYSGSVVGFVGDAITCWFNEGGGTRPAPSSRRAVASALAMQVAMAPFAQVSVTPKVTAALSLKIGLASGPARRFYTGDPAIQLIDVLAGDTLYRMSQAEGLARQGEVVMDEEMVLSLQDEITIAEWRIHPENSQRLAVVRDLNDPVAAQAWSTLPPEVFSEDQLRPWILPSLYERLRSSPRERLAELRPAASLFLRFSGLDYDHDAAADGKLDAYVRWVQQVITRHGGNVIQLTVGDKGSFLYAAFGAPIAQGDDAYRALQAGLALRRAPASLGFEPNPQIGIASGPARTGAYGSITRRSYGVIGDDTVLAARLMTAAPPGEIRCARSVYAQTRSQVAFETLPPVRVKGRVELVQVYRPQTTSAPALFPPPSLVGRRVEVAAFRAALDAVQSGATRTIVVEGEAGIGKTRLVQEVLQEIQAQGLTYLLGSGHSIERRTPYRAWRDVFIAYFDLGKLVELEARQKQVQTTVAQIAPEQLACLPLLNVLVDLDLPDTPLTASLEPELRQQNLQLLLLTLLETWAREQPLILVLEDAHWLDELSWQLVEQIARTFRVHATPLLMVLVTRPMEVGDTGLKSIESLKTMDMGQVLHLERTHCHQNSQRWCRTTRAATLSSQKNWSTPYVTGTSSRSGPAPSLRSPSLASWTRQRWRCPTPFTA